MSVLDSTVRRDNEKWMARLPTAPRSLAIHPWAEKQSETYSDLFNQIIYLHPVVAQLRTTEKNKNWQPLQKPLIISLSAKTVPYFEQKSAGHRIKTGRSFYT